MSNLGTPDSLNELKKMVEEVLVVKTKNKILHIVHKTLEGCFEGVDNPELATVIFAGELEAVRHLVYECFLQTLVLASNEQEQDEAFGALTAKFIPNKKELMRLAKEIEQKSSKDNK